MNVGFDGLYFALFYFIGIKRFHYAQRQPQVSGGCLFINCACADTFLRRGSGAVYSANPYAIKHLFFCFIGDRHFRFGIYKCSLKEFKPEREI